MYEIFVENGIAIQRIIVNLPLSSKAKRVMLEFIYKEKTNLWTVSVYDAQSGDPYCLRVPLISSRLYLNNLFAPFATKGIGDLVCIPIVDEPSSVNPSLNNWEEFALVWGEDLA